VVGLSDLTDRAAALQAIAEHDELGRETFLSRYGYGPARTYFVVHNRKRYDSKAIAGMPPFPADCGSGERHDTYGFALSAQPGKSQRRPATNSSSRLME
jgi:hypothetical protein